MVKPALNKVDNSLLLIGCMLMSRWTSLTFASYLCFLLLLTVYIMTTVFLRRVKKPNLTEWLLSCPFVFPQKKHEVYKRWQNWMRYIQQLILYSLSDGSLRSAVPLKQRARRTILWKKRRFKCPVDVIKLFKRLECAQRERHTCARFSSHSLQMRLDGLRFAGNNYKINVPCKRTSVSLNVAIIIALNIWLMSWPFIIGMFQRFTVVCLSVNLLRAVVYAVHLICNHTAVLLVI